MSTDHDALRQEVDKIDSKMIIAVGMTALVIFGLGIVWAIQIQRDSAGTVLSYTPEQVPQGRKDEIGIVYQPQFTADFAAKLHAKQKTYLESVGWVDEPSKEHGAKKVHIPIDRAIKDYLATAEQNGGKL